LAFFAPSRFISHGVLENCTKEEDHPVFICGYNRSSPNSER
jgi:hypothetical protein